MEKEVIRIGITGPESTGKSWLAENLAAYFNTIWVPEFSREYLERRNGSYSEKDILTIAMGQLEKENCLAAHANHLLFCDTEFLVCQIWSEFKYGRCDPWIKKMFLEHRYDLYLLCNIDLPWTHDPLREHPHHRKELFMLYYNALNESSFSFAVISGTEKARLKCAAGEIQKKFIAGGLL